MVTRFESERHGYDSFYRLVSEQKTGSHAYTISYTYDAVGNRLTQVKYGSTISYTYNNRDQLVREDSGSSNRNYGFDAAGRLISKSDAGGTTIYGWIDEERMASVAGPGVSVAYTYDADGRRVRESSAGVTKQYLIDALLPYGQVIAETDGSGNLSVEYVYGQERISQRRGGAASWYLTDGQGSVREIADAAGAVTDSYAYTAFGEALASTGSTANDFRYVGERWDPNGGFYYLRARWMNPSIDRMISVDPFEGTTMDPTSFHRYLYSNASPISYGDPNGEMSLLEISAAIEVSSILAMNFQPSFGSQKGWDAPTREGFDKLWAAYPGALSSEAVYDLIGGKVLVNHERAPDKFQNSCALRMSRALNYSGTPISYEKGKTGSGDDGKWYYYTVENIARFTRAKFGSPAKTKVSYQDVLMKRGIILFQTCGWDDASGHIDLWNKVIPGNSAHWDVCKDISFWRFK